MNQAPPSVATLANCSSVEVGGYSWMMLRRSDGSVELSPGGEPRLPDVTLVERPGDNDIPTYRVTVRAAGIYELAARHDGFASAEAAVAWATGFEFATRQAGNLTWRAVSAEDRHWFAVVGASVAEIFRHGVSGSPNFTVKRYLRLGTLSIEFSIADLAFSDQSKTIASFEQASAIALTMSDYVMKLMRVPAEVPLPPMPGTAA